MRTGEPQPISTWVGGNKGRRALFGPPRLRREIYKEPFPPWPRAVACV
jgi:hypothetical protein